MRTVVAQAAADFALPKDQVVNIIDFGQNAKVGTQKNPAWISG